MFTYRVDSSALAGAIKRFTDLIPENTVRCQAFANLTPREELIEAGPIEADGEGFTVRVGPSAVFTAFLDSLTARAEIGPEGLK